MTASLLPVLSDPAPADLPHLARARDIYYRSALALDYPKIEVVEPKDPARRLAAKNDLVFACGTYWKHFFSNPVDYHLAVLSELQDQILSRGVIVFRSADAAPRSIGKTTLRRLAVEWAALNRHEQFSLFIGPNDDHAEGHVSFIKNDLFGNDWLMDDYPEICGWVRGFANDPKRSPAGFPWQDSHIRLNNGCCVLARGRTSALVGLNVDGIRPGLIIMDDIEDTETVASDDRTLSIGKKIDQEIIRLHDLNRRAVYNLVGTVRTENCNMARYTDAALSPGWHGKRLAGLLKPPAREDLWAEFVEICRRNRTAPAAALALDDEAGAAALGKPRALYDKIKNQGFRAALKFYALHKTEMDAGAQLLDPVRLPLAECYRTIAEEGLRTFQTEIQNVPYRDEELLDVRSWNASFIASHASDYDVRTLPAGCAAKFATLFADVHAAAIYFSIRAWAADATSWLIEAGVEEVHLHRSTDKSERDAALLRALRRLFEWAQAGVKIEAAQEQSSVVLPVRFAMVDEGWETNLVRGFCRETNYLWRPAKGFFGMQQPRLQKSKEFAPSVNVGVYHFKHDLARLLDRPRGQPGFFHLHRDPNFSYCHHLCSERWQPKRNRDGADVQEYEWKTVNHNNHWWDCEVGNCAAAYVGGVRFNFELKPGEQLRRRVHAPGAASGAAPAPAQNFDAALG